MNCWTALAHPESKKVHLNYVRLPHRSTARANKSQPGIKAGWQPFSTCFCSADSPPPSKAPIFKSVPPSAALDSAAHCSLDPVASFQIDRAASHAPSPRGLFVGPPVLVAGPLPPVFASRQSPILWQTLRVSACAAFGGRSHRVEAALTAAQLWALLALAHSSWPLGPDGAPVMRALDLLHSPARLS